MMPIPSHVQRRFRPIAAICAAAAFCLPGAASAQPSDFARSLAADIGMVGEMGEPNRAYGFADGVKCRVRPQDEVWVISSRHLAWPCPQRGHPALKYWRWGCGAKNWRKRPAAEFFASDSAAAVTLIYIHGNRIDSWQAVDLGWYTYDAVVRRAENPRPVRYVIYSWPSTRVFGSQLDDLRCKAARTNAEGYCLAWLLANIGEEVPISLMGFSYGARIITGGLHLRGGGDLLGQMLPGNPQGRPPRVRSVLMAAALHNDWLLPEGFHGQALQASDRILVLANSSDKILRRYHWVFPGERPSPLGVTGPAGHYDGARIKHFDCCDGIGQTHDSLMYLNAPALAALWRPCVFWSDVHAP